MKPTDKFGNTIYLKVFGMLREIGKNLEINGWKESESKFNLFYKEFDGVKVLGVNDELSAMKELVSAIENLKVKAKEKVGQIWKPEGIIEETSKGKFLASLKRKT